MNAAGQDIDLAFNGEIVDGDGDGDGDADSIGLIDVTVTLETVV